MTFRWPWSKPDPEPDEDQEARGETTHDDLAEAREARAVSEQDLRQARGQRAEVERIADRIREIRQQNHLAEIFEASLRRRGESRGS